MRSSFASADPHCSSKTRGEPMPSSSLPAPHRSSHALRASAEAKGSRPSPLPVDLLRAMMRRAGRLHDEVEHLREGSDALCALFDASSPQMRRNALHLRTRLQSLRHAVDDLQGVLRRFPRAVDAPAATVQRGGDTSEHAHPGAERKDEGPPVHRQYQGDRQPQDAQAPA